MSTDLYKSMGYGTANLPAGAERAIAKLVSNTRLPDLIEYIETEYVERRGERIGRHRITDTETEFLADQLSDLYRGSAQNRPDEENSFVQYDQSHLVLTIPGYEAEWSRSASDMECYEFELAHGDSLSHFVALGRPISPWVGFHTKHSTMDGTRYQWFKTVHTALNKGTEGAEEKMVKLLGDDYKRILAKKRIHLVPPIMEAFALWSGLAQSPHEARKLLQPCLWSRVE